MMMARVKGQNLEPRLGNILTYGHILRPRNVLQLATCFRLVLLPRVCSEATVRLLTSGLLFEFQKWVNTPKSQVAWVCFQRVMWKTH